MIWRKLDFLKSNLQKVQFGHRRKDACNQQAGAADQDLLVAERHAALREALTHLPLDSQQLIALLIADPPVPYAEISARLGIPVGSIGPNRSRCLDKLRRDAAIAALVNPPKPPDGQQDAQAVGRPGK